MTPVQFKNTIEKGCKALWKNYGILPSVAFGQAALESGWGTSGLATRYNNLFGIKGSYLGNSVKLPTTEFYDGRTPVNIVDGFRAYPNWNTSILDYGNFLNVNSRYRNAIGVKDYKQQITIIRNSGYATDPNYIQKVVSIIEANGVVAWDREVLGNVSKPKPKPIPRPVTTSPNKLDSIARMVIQGKLGNGNTRKVMLGNMVQQVVNAKMSGRPYQTNDSIEYLATLVIQGRLGNGTDRVNNIYNMVQKRVNELL